MSGATNSLFICIVSHLLYNRHHHHHHHIRTQTDKNDDLEEKKKNGLHIICYLKAN